MTYRTSTLLIPMPNATVAQMTWSPPCAVGTYGLTFGAVVGAEVTDSVTALGDVALAELCDEAAAKVSLGGAASLALGPLGRTGEAAARASSSGSGARAHLPPLPPAILLRWGRLESSIRTIPNLPARSPPGDVVRACVEHQKKKEGPTHGPKPTARY